MTSTDRRPRRVLAYEHITGSGARDALAHALAEDGRALRDALVDDLRRIPGVEVVVAQPHEADTDGFAAFERALGSADAAWIVAPETGGLLETLARRAEARGVLLLSSRPEGIRVAASKRKTAEALRAAGLSTLREWRNRADAPSSGGRCIAKLDDGCGSLSAHCFPDPDAAFGWLRAVPDPSHWLVQPWIEGEAGSLSVITDGVRAEIVSINRQHLVIGDGVLALAGVEVYAETDAGGRLAALADAVVRAVPGLRGYVGIDFIRTAEEVVVVEVNPRLTTPYVVLAREPHAGIAARVLELFPATTPPPRAQVPLVASAGR